MLIDAGSEVNFITALGTPLMQAVQAGFKDTVQLLLEAGAGKTIKVSKFEDTALSRAEKKGDQEIIALIEEEIARQDAKDSQ